MERSELQVLKKQIGLFLLRVLILGVIIGIAVLLIALCFSAVDANLWDALISGNQQKMVETIEEYDSIWGVFIIAIMQIVQDVSIFIPSAPVHIAAGILLGPWKGFLTCHVADVFSNMCVFFLYFKGKKFLDKIVPINEQSKTVRMIMEGKSKPYMVIMLCLLPAVPNGFIPYAAVNAKMKLRDYVLAVTFGAAIPTFVLTMIGDRIFDGDWALMVFLILLSFVGVFFLLKYQNHVIATFDKAKKHATGASADAEAKGKVAGGEVAGLGTNEVETSEVCTGNGGTNAIGTNEVDMASESAECATVGADGENSGEAKKDAGSGR